MSRALISEGIFPWSIAMHHCLYISSSSRSAHIALSRLDTNSSKYWYLSFFLARHSLALCRLRSSFAFKSILAGFRPRLPGFFTLPPTTLLSSISADRPARPDHLCLGPTGVFGDLGERWRRPGGVRRFSELGDAGASAPRPSSAAGHPRSGPCPTRTST